MKMVVWFLCIIALFLVHTTTVVDCEFEDVDVAMFNASEGALYMEFLTPAHELLDNDPNSEDDAGHTLLPWTPKDINVPPARWLKVNLYSGGSLTPKGATYIRKDSLYTLAFHSADSVLHHSPGYENFFRDFLNKMPLPFKETYAGLTGTTPGDPVYPKLAQVQIGREAAEVAVETLSTYRGATDTASIEKVRCAYLTIVIMTSEALRIHSVREACIASWDTIGTITELDAWKMYAWSGCSVLYRTDDFGQLTYIQQNKVRRLGITTRAEAGNIIDVVCRSQE